ncbi:hypothetical protein [Marinifilum flexuosum]|uniref:hypothetical protein n=1 Tax=Marinifilum flexuosum TaxID=1117708 RepID=UPI002491667B|nr:hypothetical protein [Marinifilum flexuosum]
MQLQQKETRFRAYKLGQKGSLFSYFDGVNFTLIEAVISKKSKEQLKEELQTCGIIQRGYIDCLHITSWDSDHCEKNALSEILSWLKPRRIEYPGYPIGNIQNQIDCYFLISSYEKRMRTEFVSVETTPVTVDFVYKLPLYTQWIYQDVFFANPKTFPNPNDNSSIKLFRTGCFSVLSLGDVEHEKVKEYLKNEWLIANEVDVMILAHHGADNSINSKDFFEYVNPKIVVCSSDYDNQYEHPRLTVRTRLAGCNIPLKTTKNGDVIIVSTGNHKSNFSVQDLISDNEVQRGRMVNYKSKRAIEYDRRNQMNRLRGFY